MLHLLKCQQCPIYKCLSSFTACAPPIPAVCPVPLQVCVHFLCTFRRLHQNTKWAVAAVHKTLEKSVTANCLTLKSLDWHQEKNTILCVTAEEPTHASMQTHTHNRPIPLRKHLAFIKVMTVIAAHVYLQLEFQLGKDSKQDVGCHLVQFIDQVIQMTGHLTLRSLAQHQHIVEKLKIQNIKPNFNASRINSKPKKICVPPTSLICSTIFTSDP